MRQAEARIREKYEQEPAEFRKSAEDARKQAEAAKKGEPEILPPISAHTAKKGREVTKLRSGIPFKTEAKGGLASKERKNGESDVAEYTLRESA